MTASMRYMYKWRIQLRHPSRCACMHACVRVGTSPPSPRPAALAFSGRSTLCTRQPQCYRRDGAHASMASSATSASAWFQQHVALTAQGLLALSPVRMRTGAVIRCVPLATARSSTERRTTTRSGRKCPGWCTGACCTLPAGCTTWPRQSSSSCPRGALARSLRTGGPKASALLTRKGGKCTAPHAATPADRRPLQLHIVANTRRSRIAWCVRVLKVPAGAVRQASIPSIGRTGTFACARPEKEHAAPK